MHTLTVNNGFTASYAEKAIGVDITILHISAKNDVPAWWETYDGTLRSMFPTRREVRSIRHEGIS